MKAKNVIQHPPLRPPNGASRQEALLVAQIEELFNDVYREIALLKKRVNDLEDSEEE